MPLVATKNRRLQVVLLFMILLYAFRSLLFTCICFTYDTEYRSVFAALSLGALTMALWLGCVLKYPDFLYDTFTGQPLPLCKRLFAFAPMFPMLLLDFFFFILTTVKTPYPFVFDYFWFLEVPVVVGMYGNRLRVWTFTGIVVTVTREAEVPGGEGDKRGPGDGQSCIRLESGDM